MRLTVLGLIVIAGIVVVLVMLTSDLDQDAQQTTESDTTRQVPWSIPSQ